MVMELLLPYAAETDGITVRVGVSYLPKQSSPEAGRWFWAYHIRIENGREDVVQLFSRVWLITDGRGEKHRVEGEGVIGEQPVIMPGASYDYVSGCPLSTPMGDMVGHYLMVREDGEMFPVAIPRFALKAPVALH